MEKLIKELIKASDNNDMDKAKSLTDAIMEVVKNGTFN